MPRSTRDTRPGATSGLVAEQQLERYSRRLWERGWVANHDGNLSVRLPRGRLLITPTAMSKADVSQSDLLEVDETSGAQLTGQRKPFSELGLHLAVYKQRPDVGAVVHAHPPHATALGLLGKELPLGIMPEPVVSLGLKVPLLGYGMPKDPQQLARLEALCRQANACLMERNGVLSWGPDLETAYLRLELIEHVALITRQAGQPTLLPDADLKALVAAHQKAGLMAPEGYGRTSSATGQAPSTMQPSVPTSSGRFIPPVQRQRLAKQVTEKLKAANPGLDAAALEKLVSEELQRML